MLFTLTSLILLVECLSVSASCPTWFYYSNDTCVCGTLFNGRAHCNQQEMKAEIADGFCATSAEQEGQYYAGDCPFRHTQNNTDRMFSELPSDPDLLNDMMCGPYNRKGLLCGRCIDGYGPAVYSFDMKCANCSKMSTGSAISLYLFLELITITLFYICVLYFRLNITGGPMLGYVLFCQGYMLFAWKELFIYKYILSHESVPLQVLFKSSLILSSSWILQFLRFAIPPFCISSKLTGIHIHMLNLVTAIYPIVLVIITYILMELHAKNYRIINFLWKPFTILLNKLKITSVTNDTVIHAFATFILLSASTISYNVATIASIPSVYRVTDGELYKKVLWYDPTITAFSHEHILYGVIAVVPFILLVLIPSLLLCVYPTRIYRYLSRFISARKQLAITAFVEALNNCFKDGLNGTRDYRVLAGFLINCGPVGFFVQFIAIAATGYNRDIATAFTLILSSLIISYMRPCKRTITNLSLSYHSMVGGILMLAIHFWKLDLSIETETLKRTFIVLPVISHILVYMWAGYTLIHCITKHFGYQFNPCNCKVALTDLARDLQEYFHRSRSDYQVLPDRAAQ